MAVVTDPSRNHFGLADDGRSMDMPDWEPPADWRRIRTLETHAGGEPLRIVTDGLPEIPGETILEKRRTFRDAYDHLRTALVWEPRGHADMYGAIPTAPVSTDADLGVLFFHNDGYSTMCGHGIIAFATAALETGLVTPESDPSTVVFDTPAGRVTAHASRDGAHVESVSFQNVPSYVVGLDRTVDVPDYGTVRYDLAFGGAFYAYVDAPSLDLGLTPSEADDLIRAGRAVKEAVAASATFDHPDPDMNFLYGTIFRGPAHDGADSRNVCVFADGQIDRCPTGTGVSGRLAIQAARDELDVGESFVVESIIGSTFVGHIAERTAVDGRAAVVPVVEGSGAVTGRSEFLIDPDDPFRDGFLLR